MKILVKPKSLNINKKNADAFLFGIKGLSVFNTCNISIITLKKILKSTDKEIFVSIDKNIFDKDLKYLEKVLLTLSTLNIKGLFFYDLSVLYMVKRLNLNINLIWNQNYLVTNHKTCEFYKNEGVEGAYISSEITLNEIKSIREKTDLTLFLNVFGYQLMAFSKRKLLASYFKYIKRFNLKKNNYMIEKDNKYQVKEIKEGTLFISNYILNAMPLINQIKDIKLDYIVLDEFMINDFDKVLDIYKDIINKKVSKKYIDDKNKIIENIFTNTSLGFLEKETIYKVKNNG